MTLQNKAKRILTSTCFSLCFLSLYLYPDKKNAQQAKAESKKTAKTIIKDDIATPKKYPDSINLEERLNLHEAKKTISAIHVDGNKIISQDAILYKIPVKVGDIFNVHQTATIIKNLYQMGYFHQIKVYAQPLEDGTIALHIVIQEKPKLNNVSFVGNKAISEKDLKEKLETEKILSLSQQELKPLIVKIKKLYHQKNYHNVDVQAKLTPDKDNTTAVEFTITEGKKTFLNRISFKGNKHIQSKRLRHIIHSQEDWILSFVNRAGVYNSEMIEADKYMIEELYRNNGFINAKVVDVAVEQDAQTTNHHITYTIHEGERYRVDKISFKENDVLTQEQLKRVIPLQEGQIFSGELLRNSMDNLRILWGEYGYIFADIDPNVSIDDDNKTISIVFEADTKEAVYLNRITIKGNKKTRDKVIRRQILLEEGALITNQKMEVSKACVGLLGYFDPKNGVNWKTTRLNSKLADLDLIVNEVKTGSFNANLSYGGTPGKGDTPEKGLSANVSFGDKNFLGLGLGVATSVDISQRYKSVQGSIYNPWLFDRPIRGSVALFAKSSEYMDQINFAENAPIERKIGGELSVGYVSTFLNHVHIDGKLIAENIKYSGKLKASQRFNKADQFIADVLLRKYFQEGNQISLIATIGKDTRNGTAFPNHGYQWNWATQWSIPGSRQPVCHDKQDDANKIFNGNFHYIKTDFDVSWYTPLIGEWDLVLCLHAKLGLSHPINGGTIPWSYLYHIGGPDSIRGYLYGQVGPTWKEDSLGAKKAFYWNVEFIIPITSNLNTRAVIFYDGGTGWDTPYKNEFIKKAREVGLDFEKDFIGNHFFYRHTVGVGVRLKSPTPLQVDFGIKLNPSKRFRRHLTEMHLSMEHSF